MASRPIPAELAPVLACFRRKLEAAFGPRFTGLRLYGSWARGTQGPESDVDVAVFVSGLTRHDNNEVIGLMCDCWNETGCQLSIQAHDPEHFRRMVEREHPYYTSVEREGLPA
jgi:hypothetical protein